MRPTPAVHRLFVAAFPPLGVLDLLGEVPRPDEPGVRWVPRERWHATLRFLGDAHPHEVADRLSATRLPVANAALGPSVSTLGPDVVVVPVAGLDVLSRVIARATADLGARPDQRPFTGHLTLARRRRGAACSVVGLPVAAAFEVSEVCLVDSRSGDGGLHYDVVGRFPTRFD